MWSSLCESYRSEIMGCFLASPCRCAPPPSEAGTCFAHTVHGTRVLCGPLWCLIAAQACVRKSLRALAGCQVLQLLAAMQGPERQALLGLSDPRHIAASRGMQGSHRLRGAPLATTSHVQRHSETNCLESSGRPQALARRAARARCAALPSRLCKHPWQDTAQPRRNALCPRRPCPHEALCLNEHAALTSTQAVQMR